MAAALVEHTLLPSNHHSSFTIIVDRWQYDCMLRHSPRAWSIFNFVSDLYVSVWKHLYSYAVVKDTWDKIFEFRMV